MTAQTQRTARDIALEYVQRGWNPVPIPHKTKGPEDKGWQTRVIREADVPRYFNGAPQNIGVVLGPSSGGLTDIDLDCREAIAIAPFILPKTGAIFGRPSARMAHWLYVTDLAKPEDNAEDKSVLKFKDSSLFRKQTGGKATIVELRMGGSKGAQTVFPGSTHESGEAIAWEEAGQPAVVDGAELIKAVKLVAVGALLIRYYPGLGARHDAALALGGFLARAGYEPVWIKYFVERIAQAAGCSNVAAKRDAAFDSATNAIAGKKTFGLKSISEFFGQHVADKIAELLDYKGRDDEFASESSFGTGATGSTVDPVDLWGSFDPPTLPRSLLPDVIERFAFDQGRAMGADMSGVAMAALSACAGAIPDKVKQRVKRHDTGWSESARIWVAMVGAPSTKKTPIMAAAVRPLRRIDADMARQYAQERARYDKLSKDEKAQTEAPKQTRVVLQDTTIEAAQEVLRDSPNGVLCDQDELSGFFGSMDKYSGARGSQKDRAFYLQAFNGGPYSVHRIGRGPVFIENLSISLIGGIQPEPIRKIADESMDDGLLQRLLPVVLKPAVVGCDEEASPAVADYSALIARLHSLDRPILGGVTLDFNGTGVLRFDDGAQAYRQELERKHLDLQACKTINRKLAAHIGKYDGIFARLCVIWHCVESEPGQLPGVISEATARRVGAFLHGFLLPHALAFYAGVLGLSNDHDKLTDVAGYILAHKLTRITHRDVQMGIKSMRGSDKREMEALFDQLDGLGWINLVPGPRSSSPAYGHVNPAVHTKFAARAQAEAERRARDRAIIQELARDTT